MKLYLVFWDHTYDKELLYIFRTKAEAENARDVEQENYRTIGSFSDIIVEEWEVE